jgi:hypothetical protein
MFLNLFDNYGKKSIRSDYLCTQVLIEINRMKVLLIIILFFIFIGFLFGFSIFRFLFGRLLGSAFRFNQQTRSKPPRTQTQSKKQKKIIDSEEGEYIDYEEVKD